MGGVHKWGCPQERWMVYFHGKISSFEMDDDDQGSPVTQDISHPGDSMPSIKLGLVTWHSKKQGQGDSEYQGKQLQLF